MTVSSATNRWAYTGDAATLIFAYTNKIFADADLDVYVDGTLQTITTDYTVSGAGDAGAGNVTFVSAPAAAAEVVIVRNMALLQEIDYVENDPFDAATHEEGLDRAMIAVQQLQSQLDRVLRLPAGDSPSSLNEMPDRTDLANFVLGFDASGEPIALDLADYDASLVSSFAATLLKDRTGAAFMDTLVASAGAAAIRTDLGLVIGADVQAYDAQLADIAALALTDGNFVVGDGSNWVAEAGTTALQSLGLPASLMASAAGNLYIGDTANADATGGVTVNTLTADDDAITLKSSDVAQLYVGAAETDTHGRARKVSGAGGGLKITAFADGDAGNGDALELESFGTTAASTAATTSAIAHIMVDAHKQDGTGGETAMAANELVFGIQCRRGGSTKMVICGDEDGDWATYGSNDATFDHENDSAVVVDFNRCMGMLGREGAAPDFERMERAADLKLLGRVSLEEWQRGVRPLWYITKVVQLLVGNDVQQHNRERIREQVLTEVLGGRYTRRIEELSAGINIGGLVPLIEREAA